jgi:DNA polymerase-3 subunit chi
MVEPSFYYVQKPPLDRILIKILEKIYSQGERAVVVSPLEERIGILNTTLWTYTPTSFLPHGSNKDGQASEQPIWLSNKIENPNEATILVLLDNIFPEKIIPFKKVIFLIDCTVPEQTEFAQKTVLYFQEEGQKVIQWQQSAEGNWNALTS